MSAPRILCIGDCSAAEFGAAEAQIVKVQTANEAIHRIASESFDGIWIDRERLPSGSEFLRLQQSSSMLRDIPEGVALLDQTFRVLWGNARLTEWASPSALTPEGKIQPNINFYSLLDQPEIMGPDFCPFHTALATDQESSSTLLTSDNRYFHVHAGPLRDPNWPNQLIVTVSEITDEILQQQKLAAIHQAGRELADLRPDEIFMMEVDERIELLKENIRAHLSDLLNFEVIEIRLLELATGNLIPLLSVGIDQEAADRQIIAHPRGNGVTGFVASRGVSYICTDVDTDPLFVPGVAETKSSLTVPLMLHDQVLGTINVESPERSAFSEDDLQFLEIFARHVAFALNTLELLVAQKANTAQQSCNAIHSAVALPVDEILNDAVNVMELYIGHSSEMVDRIRRILQNARDIKNTIQKIGQKMTPLEAVPVGAQGPQHPTLRGKRILVVDGDETVRNDAHNLLERYGCIVETAHEGQEAVAMVRGSIGNADYDVIISDIRLADFSGYQVMCRLGDIMENVPMVLMTGFGYDPGHSIVKARQAGLHPTKGVLYKPFRLDQLIDVVETIIATSDRAIADA
ncbi:Transcriptional regulatory protein ZraR [Roseimaritima multifibrata]|uniref:Transcriptional regulatory protein ZraR n=1 Tax=Roseimaritima multifibrata TaxID=1930274 RepID=A0A517MCF5_9BACT|nr:response regulator [Roseimaritima multifibrata]QDS92574.1 Transcriptional regulatory protein ZraR [Roseimaritima multifibrata]